MIHRPNPDEFGLIARYLAPLAREESGAFGLLDDAAILDIAPGRRLVATADALIEGVHFFPDDPPELIGRKLLRVNLSDLAAMGAVPFAYLLTMALRDGAAEWVEAFARGLGEDQKQFSITLVGGDTTATEGPIALSITALGHISLDGGLRRSGARAGDRVFVSGTIGDGALGLMMLRDKLPGLGKDERAYLENRFRLPEPRVSLGQRLQGLASAATDVSDGLAGDLGHICIASGVGAVIEMARVPLSAATRHAVESNPQLMETVVTGGDDYELVFTVPEDRAMEIESAAGESGGAVTEIGSIEAGQGVTLLGRDGTPIELESRGYRHF